MTVLLALIILGVWAAPGLAADFYGSSKTLSSVYEESWLGRDTSRFSLYEYADVHAQEFGVSGMTLHFSGWGRWDAADTEDEDQEQPGDADLTYAYLQWKGLDGLVDAKLGRHFVVSGPTAEIMDAVDLLLTPFCGFNIQMFGGMPAYSRIGERDGDFAWGARVSYEFKGYFELGAAYGAGLEKHRWDRNNVGGDLRIAPIKYIDLVGHVWFSQIYQEVYDATGQLNLNPVNDLRVTGTYTHLFPSAFLGAMNYFSVFSAETLDIADAELSYLILNRVRAIGGYAAYTYDEADNASRPGGGLELLWGAARGNVLGGRYYRLDRGDNGYSEIRAYLYQGLFDKAHVAVNSNLYQLDNEIYGVDQAFDGDLSLGYAITKKLGVQATGIYRATPYYDSDVRGLLKITYNVERWL
ncbi:MAG: hypothetical protein IT350_14560 [Deltaproteobacteria bacterium]|nr:hypothetical protein [Deltaproteobacteria bacterium]